MTLKISRYRLALVLSLILAYTLRVHTLDRSPLWFDEALEYWVATSPTENLAPAVRDFLRDPPIYSVLLHVWMKVGNSEFVLRQLSTGASLLTIATLATLGRQVYSRTAGLFAALLLAVLPPDIRGAQEVGQYALMGFTLSLNMLLTVRARERAGWKDWLAWAVSGLAAVYTYYGSLLIIGPVMAWVLLEAALRRRVEQVVRSLVAGGMVVIVTLPLVIFWLPSQFHWGGSGGSIAFAARPLPVEISTFLNGIKQVAVFQLTGTIPNPEPYAALRTLAGALVGSILVSGLASLLRSKKHGYIYVWLATGWVLAFLAGRVGAYPYGPGRHVLILTPLLILGGAIGLAFLWKTHWSLATIIVVATMAVALIAPQEPPEDLRSVVDYYLDRRDALVPTYVYYGAVPAFRHQRDVRSGAEHSVRGVWYRDCWGALPVPHCSEDGVYYGRWIRQLPPEEKYAEIMSTLDGAGIKEFWIIFSHTADGERQELLHILASGHELVDAIEAEGASGYLFRGP